MAVTLSAGGYMRSDFMISDAAMPLRIEEIEQSESFQKIFGDLTGKPDISGASDLSAETGIEAEAVPGTEAIDFKGQGAVSDGQTKPELGQNQETEVKIPENPMAKPDTDEFSDGNVMKELAAIMAAQNPQNAIRIQPVAEKQPDQSETVDAAVIPEIAEALENAETPSLETPDIPKILASKLSAANTENVPENEEKSVSVPVDLPKAIGTKSGEGLAVSDITQDDSDDEDIIQKIIAVLIAKKSEEFEKEEKEAGENAVVPKKESETLKRVKATIISMQAEKASKLVSLKSVQEFNLETAAGEGSGVTSHMPSVIDENGEVNKDLLAELQTEAMEMIAEYVSKTGNAVHITQEQLTAAISVNVKASFGSTETNAADLTTAAKKTEEPEIDLAAVMGEITVKEVTPKEQTGNQDSGTSQNGQNPEPNSAESMKTSSETQIIPDKTGLKADFSEELKTVKAESPESAPAGKTVIAKPEISDAGKIPAKPEIKSEQPEIKSEQPEIKSEQPEIKSEQPEIKSEAPKTEETAQPVRKESTERIVSKSEELELIKSSAKEPKTAKSAYRSDLRPVVYERAGGGKLLIKPSEVVRSAANKVIETLKRENAESATEYSVTLEPEELGKITVKLTKAISGEVAVTIAAENAKTQKILMENSELLQEHIKNSGVNLEEWQVVQESRQDMYAEDYRGSAKNPYYAQEQDTAEDEDADDSFARLIASM